MTEYELYHYGVKGMKWGVRRYQNKDGSLTRLGKKKLAKEASEYYKKEAEKRSSSNSTRIREIEDLVTTDKVNKLSLDKVDKLYREWDSLESSVRHLKSRSDEINKRSKLGERYVDEYAKNVSIDKLLKAYSTEYAYYQYNHKGDKEWLLDWDDKVGPKFD